MVHTSKFNEIVNRVEKLTTEEFTQLMQRMLELKAKRKADNVPFEEVLLLEKIRKTLPQEIKTRFQVLKNKRLEETLTNIEYEEYLELIEVVEMDHANKVKNIGALALLRNRPILELGKELGIFQHG